MSTLSKLHDYLDEYFAAATERDEERMLRARVTILTHFALVEVQVEQRRTLADERFSEIKRAQNIIDDLKEFRERTLTEPSAEQEQPPSQAVADAYRRGQEDAATLVERLADESECCDLDLRDAAAAIRALPAKEPMS